MLKAIAKKIEPIWSSKDNNFKSKLIKSAAGTFGLKIVASGLAFIMSVIFARFLGRSGLGTYSYASTWANLLSIPAALGIDQLIIREIAIYRNQSNWGLLGGILRWANAVVLIAGIIIASVAVVVAWNLQSSSDTTIVWAIVLSMVTLPIISLRSLRMGAMKGLHRIVLGQVPESLFAPGIIIILTLAAYFTLGDRFNVFWVLGIKIVASIISFVIGAIWLVRSLPDEINRVAPQYEIKKWFTDALPFMFLGTSQLLNSRIDLLMLGSVKGVEAVGIYAVLLGITRLTVFIHQAANSVLAPNIATLYSQGKTKQLEKLVRKSTLMVFAVSLLIGGIIILLGDRALLIFGSEFLPGRTALNILIIGSVFGSFTGPVGILLNMTGHQNHTAIAVGVTAVMNIILNTVLIPDYGINGAAIATTTSMVVINTIKVIFVQQKLGIYLYSFGGNKNS